MGSKNTHESHKNIYSCKGNNSSAGFLLQFALSQIWCYAFLITLVK